MISIKNCFSLLLAGAMFLVVFGCTRHEVDIKPVEIKPIHITIDINVKVDKALDDFFGDLDETPTNQ
ncbi:YnbE family lipoprotein [Desulforhopalus sp. IMCC35007]|uniref:YnbE family lipoprotein n=1 Tax=Desulforhopalus sp. IMCC35007 TaxID=2569543 RepID=UPI0010AE5B3D|nr:YnbE family lipoprotein [Desulforhopalus sp. IMCC35007]TKB06614.1 YnbE family lipoprotein [Desulforhopalus sp. IMCC35007]